MREQQRVQVRGSGAGEIIGGVARVVLGRPALLVNLALSFGGDSFCSGHFESPLARMALRTS